jgi:surface antigen
MAQYKITYADTSASNLRQSATAVAGCARPLLEAANALDDTDGGILGWIDEFTGDRLLNLRGENAMAPMVSALKSVAGSLPGLADRLAQEARVYERAIEVYGNAEKQNYSNIAATVAAALLKLIEAIFGAQPGPNTPTASTAPGIPENDSAPVAQVDLTSRKITLTDGSFDANGKYEYDSFMGVPAYADKRLYDNYWKKGTFFYGDYSDGNPRYNNCAEYVNRFYKQVYGVEVHGLVAGSAPPSGTHATTTPQVGDIYASSTRGHWAIVKSVNADGTVTLIEQQQLSDDSARAGKINDVITTNRTVNIADSLFFTTK